MYVGKLCLYTYVCGLFSRCVQYRIAGNIGGHYVWRKSHKLGINNIGEILIWRSVHIGKHAL